MSNAIRLLLVLFLTILVPRLSLAVCSGGSPSWRAASCGQTDVQDCINAAQAGDTVALPLCSAGTYTWTTTQAGYASVYVNKAITLQGQGAGSTVIGTNTNQGSGTQPEVPLLLNPPASGLTRVTGITFRGIIGGWNGIIRWTGSGQTTRIDHNEFKYDVSPGSGQIIITGGSVVGVIDHNTFTYINPVQCIFVNHGGWGGDSVGLGDGSWAAASSVGAANNVFIEDNVFNNVTVNDPSYYEYGALDSQQGGRTVFRFNTCNHSHVHLHGTESGWPERSGRSMEIYRNTFTTGVNFDSWAYFRGGTGMIFNNSATNFNHGITLVNYRDNSTACAGNCNSSLLTNLGYCDTPGKYDNPSANLCIDMVGRGKGILVTRSGSNIVGPDPTTNNMLNQASEPMFIWGNTGVSTISVQSAHIQQNKDYYVAAVGDFVANAPATCTQGAGYFAASEGILYPDGSHAGVLYRCNGSNQWIQYYTPYSYPHPLTKSSVPRLIVK